MQIEQLSDYLEFKVNFPEFGKYTVIGQALERNFVFGWAGVCGEGWQTSSPIHACVGGYLLTDGGQYTLYWYVYARIE